MKKIKTGVIRTLSLTLALLTALAFIPAAQPAGDEASDRRDGGVIGKVGIAETAYADTYSTLSSRKAQNQAIYDEAAAIPATQRAKYLDVTLSDMYEPDRDMKGMTEDETALVREFADEILEKAGYPLDDVEKMRAFHDWIRTNFYYYLNVEELDFVVKYAGDPGNTKKVDNPATLLKMYRAVEQGKAYDENGELCEGIVARCNGYTATFIAFCRAEGIPARAVDGYYNKDTRKNEKSDTSWSVPTKDEGKFTHHWAMAYANGEWMMVDCNADCYNQYRYESKNEYWYESAPSFYAGEEYNYFDPSAARLSQSHIAYELRKDPCPTAPGMNTPTIVASSGKIKLSWKGTSFGANRYKLYRATSKDGTYKCIKTTASLSYTDTTAKAGTRYYYKVKAYHNDFAGKGYSTIVNKICKQPRPTGVKASNATAGKIKVSWTAPTGVTRYQVYRATSKTGTYTLLGSTTNKYYNDTKVTKGKTYYYKVKSVCTTNKDANSEFTAAVYAKVR